MRWASVPLCLGVLVGATACGFGGSGGDAPDGGSPDGPPLMPGETDLVVDSVAKWNEGAAYQGTLVSTAGGAGGSVEPVARLGGKLFVEVDEEQGPYDGTWAVHPTPAQLVRTSFQAPTMNAPIPGAPQTFVYWWSGEVRLESGAQKIGVSISPGTLGFVDVLARDGTTELVHCPQSFPSCDVTAPAAGWYPVRMAWKRPGGSGSNFDLRYAATGDVANIDPARVRAPLVTAQHSGSRLEGFGIPRGFEANRYAVMIDDDKPMDLDWGGSTFGFGGSASYRNLAQLRIPEDGTYDLVVDANGGSSHRVWLDGEWLTTATLLDYIDDNVDPPAQTFTRQLSAGWHDLIAEGYDTRGNNGNVVLTFGKSGGARAPLALAATRPALGVGPQMVTQLNATPVPLQSNAPVTRTVAISNLAATAPSALAVDVAVTLQPRAWNNLQIKIVPPDGAAIPLVFDDSQLPDNQMGKVTGSLSKAALGATAKAQGTWTVEVTHAANAQLDGTNVISEVELHVYYAGGADIAGEKLVDASSTYTRMFKLDQPRELRNLLADAIKPPGTDLRFEVQACSDEAGTTCQAPLSVEQLVERRPMAQYAKVTATFLSNGYAVPILTKLALRFLGDP